MKHPIVQLVVAVLSVNTAAFSNELPAVPTVKAPQDISTTVAMSDNPQSLGEDEFDIFDKPANKNQSSFSVDGKLSQQAKELAVNLKIVETIKQYESVRNKCRLTSEQSKKIDALILQARLKRSLEHASFELQETFANIDGDMAQNNMLLAFASARFERSMFWSNFATFTGTGGFGILDSSTQLARLAPTSEIFGILASSTSVVLPLLSLRTHRYRNPRHNEPRLNMIAPLFDADSQGDGYSPIVWKYVNTVPPVTISNRTRREMLVESWKAYRGFGKMNSTSKLHEIAEIINAPSRDNKLTLDALKRRAELLIDLRALIQAMYRDLSELDSSISIL